MAREAPSCITPSIFPNLGNKNQTFEEQQVIIKEVNRNWKDVKLFPNFIAFMRKIKIDDIIYVVTGRKACNFLGLTLEQLINIDYDQLIFYPNNKNYTNEEYVNWKFHTIQYLIKMHHDDHVIIFDDNIDYFEEIKQHVNPNNFKYKLYQVESNHDWWKLL